MNDMTLLRANILGGLNAYILDTLTDEELIEGWLTYGVPDGADEEMLLDLCEDTEIFNDILSYGAKLLR